MTLICHLMCDNESCQRLRVIMTFKMLGWKWFPNSYINGKLYVQSFYLCFISVKDFERKMCRLKERNCDWEARVLILISLILCRCKLQHKESHAVRAFVESCFHPSPSILFLYFGASLSFICPVFFIFTFSVFSKYIIMFYYDAAGQERFGSLISSYYRGAHAIILGMTASFLVKYFKFSAFIPF